MADGQIDPARFSFLRFLKNLCVPAPSTRGSPPIPPPPTPASATESNHSEHPTQEDSMIASTSEVEELGFVPDDTLDVMPKPRVKTHFPDESKRGPDRVTFLDPFC